MKRLILLKSGWQIVDSKIMRDVPHALRGAFCIILFSGIVSWFML